MLGAWHKRLYKIGLAMADRPPRLHQVFQRYDPPLYFVTFNTHQRQKLLANAHVHVALIHFAHEGEVRGIGLGRYVIMRMLKRALSSTIPVVAPHWQHGFFDHLIRHSESYAAKWEYVRQNPVRAGLVHQADEWPWQGEIIRLEARSV
jgi:REP-associated tyrosine transposase